MRSEHDPEKWKPVFAKDHAQTISSQPIAGFLRIGFYAVHPPYRKMAIKWQPARRGASS
jgi:hypothetical protein